MIPVCSVCLMEIRVGEIVLQIPNAFEVARSKRDPDSVYYNPKGEPTTELIHYHCAGEYFDPRWNDTTMESIRQNVSEEKDEELRDEIRQEVLDELVNMGIIDPELLDDGLRGIFG